MPKPYSLQNTIIIIIFISVIASILGFWGVRTGLPSKERFNISLGGAKTFDQARPKIEKVLESRIADRSEFTPKDKKLPLAKLSPYFDQLRTYHPDEQYILKVLSRMVKDHDIHPRSYIYGPFFFYQIGAGLAIGKLSGFITGNTNVLYFLANPDKISSIYLSARTVCVLFGIATVVLTFLIGQKIGGPRLGIVSSLFLAFLPLFCLASKFIKPDIPATFWCTMALWFALNISESGKWKNYLLSGVCVGLAAGTKYPAAITGGYFIMFHILDKRIAQQNNKLKAKNNLKLLGGAVASAVTFILVNPASLFDTKCFISDINWISGVLRTGSRLENLWDGFICYGQDAIFYTMGIPAVLMIIFGIISALFKRDRFGFAVIPVITLFFFFTCQGRPTSDAYFIPVYPALAILACKAMLSSGAYITDVTYKMTNFIYPQNNTGVENKNMNRSKASYIITVAVITLTLIITLSYTWAYVSIAGKENIRITAARWVNENIPLNSTIAFKQYPVGYRTVMVNPKKYKLLSQDLDINALEAEYFIDNSFEWKFSNWNDRVKQHDVTSVPPSEDFSKFIEFENIPHAFFGLIELNRKHMLAHYIEVVSPRISIYKRKKK
jgi:hypothetical protein